MQGNVTWWSPRSEHGRIRGTDGKTYHFERAWVEPEARDHTFRRDELVAFDGDRRDSQRVAYRVVPVDGTPRPARPPRER